MEFEFGVRYTYTEASMLTREGQQAVDRYTQSVRINEGDWQPLNEGLTAVFLPSISWESVGIEAVKTDGEYRGKFSKRIAAYYFKAYGIKCPDAWLSHLGNIAAAHMGSDTYEFDFDADLDWERGAYGDRNSCYWGANAGARAMLRENDGFAIRFYRPDGRGFARAWVVSIEESCYIVFNGYGLDHHTIARVMAGWAKESYHRVYLTNNESTGGVLYINSDGIIVGDADVIAEYASYDFQWDDIDACCACGEALVDESGYHVDGDTFCYSCYEERFSNCEHCGEDFEHDAISYEDGHYTCRYCLESLYNNCERCQRPLFHRNTDVIQVEDRFYCVRCK